MGTSQVRREVAQVCCHSNSFVVIVTFVCCHGDVSRSQGDHAEWLFCSSNHINQSSLRMTGEARVRGGGRGGGGGGGERERMRQKLIVLFIHCLQQQLKDILLSAGFPEGKQEGGRGGTVYILLVPLLYSCSHSPSTQHLKTE